MDDDLDDDRFAHIATDVRFRGIPRQERRIKIDKRFQSMFTDERFKLKSAVDKRGRPQSYSASENLRKYYDISSSSSSASSEEEDEDEHDEGPDADGTRPSTPTPRSARRTNVTIPVRDEDSESDDDSGEEEGQPVIDYARGHGNIESSSEDDSEEHEDEDVEMIHPWGELDEKAERTTEAPTKRIAVCNMDWDRVKAQDIYVLLSSFVPSGGVILSIKIYLSDFGRERLSKEDVEGPEELISFGGTKDAAFADDDKDIHRERVRRYQLSRLRYFYAVVECDSSQTAGALYDECDGLEYESSATRLDLRFIPGDMEFLQEPHSAMDTSVDVGRYRPQRFTTAALQQSNVHLTWDETSADRIQVFQRAFNQNEDDENDLKTYLASSSSSSSDDDDDDNIGRLPTTEDNNNADNAEIRNVEGEEEEDRIAKYKSLLSGIENGDEMTDNGDVHMEITWGPGLKEQAETIVQKKLLEKEAKYEQKASSWERYLEKRKEKRQQKFKEMIGKAKNRNKEPAAEGLENPYSDDELPDNGHLDDPYFKLDDDAVPTKKAISAVKSKKAGKKMSKSNVENEIDECGKAKLELLMMDEHDHKNHFSLKKLLKSDKKSSKKEKNNVKLVKADTIDDDFEMNVNDARFTAVYTSHLFNIDPSEPHFKKTGGMAAMVGEKQRRVAAGMTTSQSQPKRPRLDASSSSSDRTTVDVNRTELSLLVKSVKSKAKSFMKKKRFPNR